MSDLVGNPNCWFSLAKAQNVEYCCHSKIVVVMEFSCRNVIVMWQIFASLYKSNQLKLYESLMCQVMSQPGFSLNLSSLISLDSYLS